MIGIPAFAVPIDITIDMPYDIDHIMPLVRRQVVQQGGC
jgi:hypothetical protein